MLFGMSEKHELLTEKMSGSFRCKINNDKLLKKLLKIVFKYKNRQACYELYVYKLANDVLSKDICRKWLVVMQKLPDTITNEEREVVDVSHAKYRANKLKVI